MLLEYPFSEIFHSGYLIDGTENRKHVSLVGFGFRTTMSYARYLMCVYEGRFLHKIEQVDHIDDDKTNDTLGNLQILSVSENNRKESKRRGRQVAIIECPQCRDTFTIRKGNSQAVNCNKGKVKVCSKSCHKLFPFHAYTRKELTAISERSLLDVRRIHE